MPVTLAVPYIRRIAASYRHLKSGLGLPDAELQTLVSATTRCLKAHASQQLALAPEVKLPLDVVVRMLQHVREDALARQREQVPVDSPRFLQRIYQRARVLLGVGA